MPVQTTLLPHVAIWDIKPDLGLVVAALIGVLAGELEGLMVGLAIGWILNLYSAGDLWLNLVTTGGAGLFAGLLARQVAEMHPDDFGRRAALAVVGRWSGGRVEHEACDDG